MSLNTAHLNNGVLIHSGECIILFCGNVAVEWSGQENPAFKGTKTGRIYLTTHRMIFNNKNSHDQMQSFSFPFITLSDASVVELEQPVFGANYIKGKVRAQPNGNWVGEAKFKLQFKHGGAIDFGQAMLRAARMATHQMNMQDPPPPYVPPGGEWYAAPPPAYAPPAQGYYGWVPPTQAFPDHPPANSVFMTNGPPPYPGINTGPQQPGFNPQQGYPGSVQGYAGQAPSAPLGYPQSAAGGFQPPFNPGDAKAAEAAQSAYYDPNRPQMAYVPPPAYYENPPSYQQATNKKDQ